MNIVILGAKGNLGTQLTKLFQTADNYQVWAWDAPEIDVFEESNLKLKLEQIKPEVIINAIAYNAVDKCEHNQEEYQKAWQLNVELPRLLSEFSQENQSILIHYSSDYVFSSSGPNSDFSEEDQPNPVNVYGKTKREGEKTIKQSYYIIRTSKLFGPQGESEFSKKSFFEVMQELAQTHNELKIIDEEISCFTYTPDLAEYTKKLLESEQEYGIYHLVNPPAYTWYQAFNLFQEKNDVIPSNVNIIPVSAEEFNREAPRPKSSILKNTKFESLPNLGYALDRYVTYLNN